MCAWGAGTSGQTTTPLPLLVQVVNTVYCSSCVYLNEYGSQDIASKMLYCVAPKYTNQIGVKLKQTEEHGEQD